MFELSPSQKGAVAEAAIATAAMELGLTVLRPLCEGRRYDLVIDLEPRLLRVQCKLARRDGGALQVPMKTNRFTPSGYRATQYTTEDVDAIAAYCATSKRSYLLPMRDVADRGLVHLRLAPTRNNQASRIRWARDYELATIGSHWRGTR